MATVQLVLKRGLAGGGGEVSGECGIIFFSDKKQHNCCRTAAKSNRWGCLFAPALSCTGDKEKGAPTPRMYI